MNFDLLCQKNIFHLNPKYDFAKSEKNFVKSKNFGANASVGIFYIHYSIEKGIYSRKITRNFRGKL